MSQYRKPNAKQRWPLVKDISEINIAATAMITQFFLGCILSTGAWLLSDEVADEPFWKPEVQAYAVGIAGVLVRCSWHAVFLEADSSLWVPLFGLAPMVLPMSLAMLAGFLADAIVVLYLARHVEGARGPLRTGLLHSARARNLPERERVARHHLCGRDRHLLHVRNFAGSDST